ncbi:MAG: patatin-like phospholipase family protein [Myxococcales bacterium]|nr:patatin-like phospholipase family protein [Myxococcales bacterium]
MTQLAHLHEQRRPFEDLESALVKLALQRPGDLHDDAVDALRYVIRFSKMHLVRNRRGEDVDVSDRLRTLGERVIERLSPALTEHEDLWMAMRSAPELLRKVREHEQRIYQNSALDPESLHAEVCTRQLVVACSGGGGSGYGYAGAWTLLHRRGLQPELIAGTSIGALMSLFRARRRVYDGVPLIEASKRLAWDTVFRVLDMDSRYGIPATLRLYLRSAIGSLFQTPDGRPLTFKDLEIPLLVVTTGIGVEAFKYDMKYYEHLMDDAVAPGARPGVSRIRQLAQIAGIFRDFMSTPDALREVVFGADPATHDADILDAAGFSASIPGLIHYDVLRDDRRMKALLDDLYSRYGITRLSEGGLVNNMPARPAWNEVQSGRIGRRNAFVLALDCFSPRLRYPLFYTVQQAVRPNVQRNIPYANLYFPMQRVLSPLNLVPALPDVTDAMRWTMEELGPHMPFIERMCNPIRELPAA